MRSVPILDENREPVSNSIVFPAHAMGLIQAIEWAAEVYQRHNGSMRRMDPIERGLIEFMAEILPDEGLDLYLGQFPKNDTRLTTIYLALFSSQSASTVITSSQSANNITEAVFGAYARQSLATATWGAQAAGTGGRKTTYPQVTFPTVTSPGDTINGFWIADILSSTGDKAIGQANFDDTTAVVLATNDVIKVTPTIQLNN